MCVCVYVHGFKVIDLFGVTALRYKNVCIYEACYVKTIIYLVIHYGFATQK